MRRFQLQTQPLCNQQKGGCFLGIPRCIFILWFPGPFLKFLNCHISVQSSQLQEGWKVLMGEGLRVKSLSHSSVCFEKVMLWEEVSSWHACVSNVRGPFCCLLSVAKQITFSKMGVSGLRWDSHRTDAVLDAKTRYLYLMSWSFHGP